MITETFLQLLKQEAANILQVGSDRVKVEYKQFTFSEEYQEKTETLMFLLSVNMWVNDETEIRYDGFLNNVFVSGLQSNIDLYNKNLNYYHIVHEPKCFVDRIFAVNHMPNDYPVTMTYLSFEKF